MNKVVIPNALMFAEVRTMLDEGKDVIIPTKGNSMLPFIRGERDSVNLRKPDGLETGDIVLAELRSGVFVLHRIVAMDGDDLTLKGDGNLRGVEKCRKSDVVGTAFQILKDGKKVIDCRSRKSKHRASFWSKLGTPVRRIYLAIYRRLFI